MKTSRKVSGWPLVLLFLLAGFVRPQPGGSVTGTEQNEGRSEQEIRLVWNLMKPEFSGSPFSAAPSVAPPFHSGAVERGFAEDGIRITNFVRFLAGLPSDVTVDRTMSAVAQHGAVLLAASDDFAHELPAPAGMDESFYRIALSATTTSNIARGFWTLEASIRYGYMRDDDPYNLTTLGHRRWILNPPFRKTGFGYAEGYHNGSRRKAGDSAMIVHDWSGTVIPYEYIAWPARGSFPREFFDSDDPWSVSLNPDIYSPPDIREVQVKLTRLADGKSWTLDRSDAEVNTDREYFNINNERYGIPNVIIFRPPPAEIGVTGTVNVTGDFPIQKTAFDVEISGIRTVTGSPAKLAYRVDFFDLETPSSSGRILVENGEVREKR